MESNSNQLAINNGLFIGGISIILGIVVYYVAPQLLASFGFGILIALISLGLYIFFTLDLRKKVGGFWSFREALKGIFLMSFIAALINISVNFVFYKFIEPGAYDKVSEILTQNLSANYEKLGMDQAAIDQAIPMVLEKMKTQFDPSFTDLMKSLGGSILFGFVMSLIFAAIFKKEQPIFTSTEE
ncbi:MAG: DUF4199 domain-containing protein [Sphingobacteriales bacterium]|jgi:hypothetical protein|nr:DUF4199 domain-containing protein [Sphingobacteriales bacterium]